MFFQAVQIIRHTKFRAIFAVIMDLFCCGVFNKWLDIFFLKPVYIPVHLRFIDILSSGL